jgi:hypothetical protein
VDVARIDSLLPVDPRVQRAGFWGGLVYLHLLLLNRAHKLDGLIPPQYCSPDYLARYLGAADAPLIAPGKAAEAIRGGLQAAAREALISIEPDGCRLVDRVHWESDSAPRVRRHRAAKRAMMSHQSNPDTSSSNECANMAHLERASQASITATPNSGWPSDGGVGGDDGSGAILEPLEAMGAPGARRAAAGSGIHPIGRNVTVTQASPSSPLPPPPPFPPLFSPPQTPPLISPPNPPSHPLPSSPSATPDCNVTVTDSPELPFPPQWMGHSAPSERKSKKRAAVAAEALTLADVLREWVRRNAPNTRMAKAEGAEREALVEKWADPIDKLHRIDQVSWRDIAQTIDWVGGHHFWGGVILSGDNLRDKWDKIQAQRSRAAGPSISGRMSAGAAWGTGEQKL